MRNHFFHHSLQNLPMSSDASVLKAALFGALLGSIATFILLQVGEFIKSVKDRRSMHLNSLVRLETELMTNSQVIYENLEMIPGFIASLKKPAPHLHPLNKIGITGDYFQELHNIALKNDLLTYQTHIRKLNQDMTAVQAAYMELREGIFSGERVKQAAFVANAGGFISWLQQLEVALQLQLQELDALAAKVRLHLQKDPSWIRRQKVKLLPNSELSESEINAEVGKLGAERIDSAKQDRERVDKIRRGKAT